MTDRLKRQRAEIKMPSSDVPAVQPGPRRWYAITTEPRAEWMVHRRLREQGFETLHLHYPAAVSHSHRVIGVLKPLFPGYVFVGLTERQGMLTVAQQRGVTQVVSSGAGALDVPPRVIEALRRRGDANGRITIEPDKAHLLAPGTKVRITAGLLDGMLAEVALDNGEEVRLWVEMFRGVVEATMRSGSVEVVSPA